MGMPVEGSYTQTRFRFRNDDGSETAASWKAAETTNVDIVVNTVFRLRVQVAQTISNANQNLSKNFKVRFSLNSGAYVDVAAIGATTTAVRYASSANVADGATTTSQLTAASGTFLAGRIDNNNDTGTLTFDIQQYTDLEFVLELYGAQLTAEDTLDFRVYETGNTALNSYTNTPRATALFYLAPSAPTLLTPADTASIALGAENTFTWQYNGNEPGDSQGEFAFRRQGENIVPATPTLDSSGSDCVFSPDNSLLVTTRRSSPPLHVISTLDWSVIQTPSAGSTWAYACRFNPSGTLLAVGTGASPYLVVFNTSDWSIVSGTPVYTTIVYDCKFNHDGSLLAVAHGESPYLTVLNTSDWSTVSGTPILGTRGYRCEFSPNGAFLAFSSLDSFLNVLNTSDWSQVSGIPTLSDYARGFAFTPDSSLLAVTYHGTTPGLTVLNTSDWSTVSGTPTAKGNQERCSFSPDGSFLAIASRDLDELIDHVRVIRVSDWSVLANHPQPPSRGFSVAFQHNSEWLAVVTGLPPGVWVVSWPLAFPQYWNGTSWQDTEVFIASATESVVFPPNSWE